VQIIFDEGDRSVGNSICKDAAEADQAFGDVTMFIP
jgi:hypothetical protein